jgi:hypothetical protein
MWAVRSNSNTYITVNPANDTYTIFIDSDANGVYTAGVDTRLRNNAMLQKDVDITNTTFNGNTFIFNNRGLAASTTLIAGQNNYDVHLTSPSGIFLGVRVNIAGGIMAISSTDNGANWNLDNIL